MKFMLDDDVDRWWSWLMMTDDIDDRWGWWSMMPMVEYTDDQWRWWWSNMLMISDANFGWRCWSMILMIESLRSRLSVLHNGEMHQPGIEPGTHRWQRCILPLDHWCMKATKTDWANGIGTETVCPSGLRGWTQVPLAWAAWAQIPQRSLVKVVIFIID